MYNLKNTFIIGCLIGLVSMTGFATQFQITNGTDCTCSIEKPTTPGAPPTLSCRTDLNQARTVYFEKIIRDNPPPNEEALVTNVVPYPSTASVSDNVLEPNSAYPGDPTTRYLITSDHNDQSLNNTTTEHSTQFDSTDLLAVTINATKSNTIVLFPKTSFNYTSGQTCQFITPKST